MGKNAFEEISLSKLVVINRPQIGVPGEEKLCLQKLPIVFGRFESRQKPRVVYWRCKVERHSR